jgi:hypothetical protein
MMQPRVAVLFGFGINCDMKQKLSLNWLVRQQNAFM